MRQIIGIGHQDFETVRTRNIFYVDKTELIKEWWEAEDEVTLIACPITCYSFPQRTIRDRSLHN